MKQEQRVAFKTLAIKARVANYIRTTLYKKKLEEISKEDKVKLFDTIFQMNHESHWELNRYKSKRKYKAHILEERLKRGIQPKSKTTKEEYLKKSLVG